MTKTRKQFIEDVARQFCKLSTRYKVWIGQEFDVLTDTDANLSEIELEQKIWSAVLDQAIFDDFCLSVAHYSTKDY